MIAMMVLGIRAALHYSMATFAMAEEPSRGINQCIRLSVSIMRRRKLLLTEHISGKFSGQIENAADSLLRILFDSLERKINRRSKRRTGGSMCHSHDGFPLFIINIVFPNGYPY